MVLVNPSRPSSPAIRIIEGRGIVVRGSDIDTDRIIPAQFMKTITFAGLEKYVFYNERQLQGGKHPFDDPRFQGASILVVNKNFGCGSSREHAPQALKRWGIRALVGESFAEIFFGNCLALGVPCLKAEEPGVLKLMELIEASPETVFTISLEALELKGGGLTLPLELPPSARERFLKGSWDPLSTLLEAEPEIEALARKLPYTRWR